MLLYAFGLLGIFAPSSQHTPPEMGLPRGLKPATGVFLGLGAGYLVVSLHADSEARRRAAAWRREVLTTALRRRFHGEATAATRPASPGSPAVSLTPRFYVVTGPDAHLTSLGRESVSHTLLCDRAGELQLHSRRSDGGDNDDRHDGVLSRRPARLAVPFDLTLGTGHFSSLVEQQVLRSHNEGVVENGGGRGGGGGSRSGDRDGSEPGAEDGMPPESDEPESGGEDGLEQQLQQHHSSSSWRNAAGEVRPEEGRSPPLPTPPTATAKATATATATAMQTPPPSLSAWESLVLWATLIVLDGQQLDDAALWALERALSGVESRLHNHDNQDDEEIPSLPAGPTAHKSCNFVLEISQPATTGGGAAGERSEPGMLCGDLVRLGWRLASLGLGNVVVSSSNPWVLAELQQALKQQPAAERKGISEERSEERPEESSPEVIVVRVALPSAAERKHSVLAVARDVGVDDRLSAVDVSMLEDLTGGRRAELLNVLGRFKQTSSGAATVPEACQAAVDDQARVLAAAWGLLSRNINSNISGGASDEEAVTVAKRLGTAVADGSTPSSPSTAASGAASAGGARSAGNNGGDGSGGRAEMGGGTSREDWSPLWEAMAMLSVPSVSVGAVGAGATSAPSPPPGSVHPAELLEECGLDGRMLLRFTKEGWLELSPAAPPISGTILEHPGHPPLSVTVHLATMPLESLSRGVDRSFVGAPPLRVAAFRRLLDRRGRYRHRSLTMPLTSHDQGVGDGRREDAGSGVEQGLRYGSGVAYGVTGTNGSGGAEEQESNIGGLGHGETVDAGGGAAGLGDRELGLERAGYLIEASVLSRDHARQSALLSEDESVLASNWAELGTARRDLARAGKDDDTSDGEWAEVQLELIRQERAVVARAIEMRARRARVDSLRRDILGLESSAGLRPPSPREEYRPDSSQPLPSKGGEQEEEEGPGPAAQNTSTRARTAGFEQGYSGGFAEEVVLRDAERRVRLMPLLSTREKKGDGGGDSRGGGAGGGAGGRGVGVGRLWRWLRGS